MKWFCESCKNWYKLYEEKPAIEAKACVWYGTKGRPPWKKPDNDRPLKATFSYCKDCV